MTGYTVPYTFAQLPPGAVIPLGQLDANFAFIEMQLAGGGGQIVSVVQGGTGATSPNAAMANLLPLQTGNAGKFLTTDGNGVLSWAAGGGTSAGVSSFSGGTTGLLPTGATTGAITLSGTLSIANGGTGATTAVGAINGLLPTQVGNAGKFLVTDGTNVTWGAGIPGSGTVTSVDASGGTTGMSFSGGPIFTAGVLTLTGVLAATNGGTGISSTPAAGQILIGNGVNYTLNTLTAGAGVTITNGPGTVTISSTGGGSGVADLSFGTTGLTPSIPTTGSIVVGGVLGLANGGTGQTSSAAALGALLPSQVGNTGKYLQTDGFGVVSWQAPSGVGLGNYGAITVSSSTPGPSAWALNGGTTVNGTGNLNLPDSGIAAQGVLTAATLNLVNTLNPGGHIVTNGTVIDLTCATNKLCWNVSYNSASQTDVNYFTSGTLVAYHTFTSAGFVGLYGQTFADYLYEFNAAGELTVNAANTFKPGGGVWQIISDGRTKKNITPYSLGVDAVCGLNPVNFQYNGELGTPKDDKTYQGLIAQDLLGTPFESMVSETTYKDGKRYTVDTNQLIYALINCVKELKARIDEIEGKQ
jgi:hypothetical protein